MRVAIIGGGIAGLTAAYTCKKQGMEPTVFEKESFIGGRMRTDHTNGELADIGAQFLSSSYTQFFKLAKELGLENILLQNLSLKHEIYHEGCIRSCSLAHPIDFLSTLEKGRLMVSFSLLKHATKKLDLFDSGTHELSYDHENTRDYLSPYLGERLTDLLVDALIAAYQFEDLKDLSASIFRAGFSSLVQNELYPSVYTKGGIDKLATELARRIPIYTESSVTDVIVNGSSVAVLTETMAKRFDSVIFACDANNASKLLKTATIEQEVFLKSIQYASTITCYFFVPSEKARLFSIVSVPKKENGIIASYYPPFIRDEEGQKKEPALVAVFLRDQAAKDLMQRSDSEIEATVLENLLKVCPPLREEKDQISLHRLFKIPRAMPKFSPGSIHRFHSFLENGQGQNGIYFAGDYLNAPWIEGSIRSGIKAAELLLTRSVRKVR